MNKQWKTVKENWLILLVFLVLVLLLSNFDFGNLSSYNEVSVDRGAGAGTLALPGYGDDFAPDQDVRKITYYASVGVEVDKGEFSDAEGRFNDVVESRNAIVLNRNVNSYGEGVNEVMQGYYSLRVDVNDLDDLLDDLKEIGEVVSYSKDAIDITGNYVSLQERLRIEQDKLNRLKSFLDEAEEISDKIQLNEQIANQERTVEYLQEALLNQDERIEYATVNFNLMEEQSDFANITFVTFGELVRSFVSSVAGLLKLIFILIPYAIVIWLIWFVVKRNRR